jgi:hypothetical protein
VEDGAQEGQVQQQAEARKEEVPPPVRVQQGG